MLPSTSDTLPVNWEPLPNYFRMLLNLSKSYLFLAFHNAHDIVAHLSNSNYGSQSTSIRNSAKNSITSLGHLWILPWQIAQRFLAKGDSHKRWPTDSGFFTANLTPWVNHNFPPMQVSFISKILEQARHTNILTLGGTFNAQKSLCKIGFEEKPKRGEGVSILERRRKKSVYHSIALIHVWYWFSLSINIGWFFFFFLV